MTKSNVRPSLVIESTGGASLGRCYAAMYYKITSTRKLNSEMIKHLWDAGFLGYGQEFMIKSKCDGTEQPEGVDVVESLNEDGSPQINPYSHKPYPPSKNPYYCYNTEARVDSSD